MLAALYDTAKRERIKRECAEKPNPFAEYSQHYDEPWVFHELGAKCDLWKRGRQDYERKNTDHPQRKNANYWFEFKPLPMEVMVAEFFTESGKPRLLRLGKHVEKWLVWVVTQGFYRMDQNKKMFTFKGVNPTILHFKCSKGFWDRVDPPFENFPILRDITEACNRLYARLLAKLSRYDSKSPFYKAVLQNLVCFPELVMFQTYRDKSHKHYQWKHQPAPLGGNMMSKPEKHIELKKHSVHRILQDFHDWLPAIKKS